MNQDCHFGIGVIKVPGGAIPQKFDWKSLVLLSKFTVSDSSGHTLRVLKAHNYNFGVQKIAF